MDEDSPDSVKMIYFVVKRILLVKVGLEVQEDDFIEGRIQGSHD